MITATFLLNDTLKQPLPQHLHSNMPPGEALINGHCGLITRPLPDILLNYHALVY